MKLLFVCVALGALVAVEGFPGLVGNTASNLAAALDTATQNLLSKLPSKFSKYLTDFPEQLKEFINQNVEQQSESLKAFLGNLEKMAKLDASGLGFQTGLNEFSMIDNIKFNAERNRLIVPPTTASPSVGAGSPDKRQATPTVPLPASVNWVGTGAVSVVKNQGSCGSCWAFAANGAVVGAWYAKYKNTTNLSEQNLMDCAPSTDGCKGGWMIEGYNYIKNNQGVDTDSSYPYRASKSLFCKYSAANRGALVASSVTIPSGDENAVAAAVAIQPVATGLDAHNLQYYKSGFYSCNGTANFNHGVLIVGYGNINGTDAWIVKNSWGPTWGAYKGYFYVPKDGKNQCGIVSHANYPIAA